MLKWLQLFWCNLTPRNFHIPEKYETFNFNSQQQNVQSFYHLTGTIYHVMVTGDLLMLY